jgi:alkanesulfonate monooxygenase SsuD/methylene tetrahydromethanopterin reductase-like flavin-dependent oxidoreductase (luciferase family)
MLEGDLERRRALVARVAEGGLDHLFLADHVSFHTGRGMDGLINAATLAASHGELEICVGVYLLALRHPVPVARQIASLCQSAPGRLILGVGVGGEDRHEIEVCDVDPSTRGRRTDESLALLRPLLRGEKVSAKGEFFAFEDALIVPSPDPPVPVVIGGRSDAAVRRAARYGDGWLGAWCSPRRLGEVAQEISGCADEPAGGWLHGLQIWVGFDDSRAAARERLAAEMQSFYHVPFDRFERYSPFGTPEQVAEFLAPYVDSGCRLFNIKPVAPSEEAGIDAVAEVTRLLRSG